MTTQIVTMGSSSLDAPVAKAFDVGPASDGVLFSGRLTSERLEIATDEPPAPGAKITASQPITMAQVAKICGAPQPGGGALNQSLRLAEHARRVGRAADVCFLDTSTSCNLVAEACSERGIEPVALARHNCPINVVSPFGSDKLIVRSPVKFCGGGLDQNCRRQIAAAGLTADVVVCVSPKDVLVASELFQAAPRATRYLQPTGSLPAEPTLELARQCDGLACNVAELCDWAAELGLGSWVIDESSAEAASEAVDLLADLCSHFQLRLRIGAITLGRQGCVVVDFRGRRSWAIDILTTETSPPTPSGAGDFWHAMWIYHREIARLDEPHAAQAATQTVAAAIGLQPGTFQARIREIPLARRRIDRPSATSPAFQHDVLNALNPLYGGQTVDRISARQPHGLRS